MSQKIEYLLDKVLNSLSNNNKKNFDKNILLEICEKKELDQVNQILYLKDKIFIYVNSNAVLYELSLKKEKIKRYLIENKKIEIKDIVFKIGVINADQS